MIVQELGYPEASVKRMASMEEVRKLAGSIGNQVISLCTNVPLYQTSQRIFIPGAKKILKVEVYIEDVVEESGHQEKMAYKKMNFIWPVEGRLGDGYDETEGRRHMGIDISSPAGTTIKASGSGKVIYSGNTIRGYGNLIILRHSEEYVTIYGHNEANLVEEGKWVERGQVIGKVGQTGRATGPHLHFEIRKNNKAIDPLLFLK